MTNSKTTLDRRTAILDYLLAVKKTNYKTLMQKFHVSKVTLINDVNFIRDTYSILINSRPGPGGGISIDQRLHQNFLYLSEYHVHFLLSQRDISNDPKVRQVYNEIIAQHISPRHREIYGLYISEEVKPNE